MEIQDFVDFVEKWFRFLDGIAHVAEFQERRDYSGHLVEALGTQNLPETADCLSEDWGTESGLTLGVEHGVLGQVGFQFEG